VSASLRTRLRAELHSQPQRSLDCDLALREIEEGLARLARHGYVFHLEPGPAPVVEPPWPRLMFHSTSAPNGRVVNSPWDLSELGPDWWPTLEEAQHADGLKAQFAGRGGLGRAGGLVPTGELPDQAGSRELARRQIAGRVEQWKLARTSGTEQKDLPR
jgi:hypothetical protein